MSRDQNLTQPSVPVSPAPRPAKLAIVTPSYEPDFELCRTLNRSVIEFWPSSVTHYIFVDRRDRALFQTLAGPRTTVVNKEELIPRGMFQLPYANRWFSTATFLPLAGWLVQQIAKIAAATYLTEDVLVMVDSDAVFVRDVDPRLFVEDSKSRLYRQPYAIRSDMTAHVEWHRHATELMGLPIEHPPMHDYIGQVIGWDRAIVRAMCERIEATTGTSWHTALARTRKVSEYLLYGIFVEGTPAMRERVWIDERSRVRMHWDFDALSEGDVRRLAHSLSDGDLAMMISSHSATSQRVRGFAIELATNGRLHS